jgi:hypothetical protein
MRLSLSGSYLEDEAPTSRRSALFGNGSCRPRTGILLLVRKENSFTLVNTNTSPFTNAIPYSVLCQG